MEHMSCKSELQSTLKDSGIPERMWGGITRYIIDCIPPGDFLRSIIINDLSGAFGRADDENEKIIKKYVQWFYSYAPALCWGSEENMSRWLLRKEAICKKKQTE